MQLAHENWNVLTSKMADVRYLKIKKILQYLRSDSSYFGSGGVQRMWAWQRGRSDLDPRSRTVFLVIIIIVVY